MRHCWPAKCWQVYPFQRFNGDRVGGGGDYPFCTIEPNVGQCLYQTNVWIGSWYGPSAKTIPTFLEFVDIAGLVRGASGKDSATSSSQIFAKSTRWYGAAVF